MGKGGAISLVDGEIISLDRTCAGAWRPGRSWKSARAAGIKTRSPVDDWMIAIRRGARFDAKRCVPTGRGRRSRRTAMTVFNRYRPPAHPTERRRSRDVRSLLRAARSGRRGAGMVLALARPQGAPAVGADGRGDHGGGGIRVRPRDAVRYPRAAVRRRLRRAVRVRRADGDVGLGALQRPAGRRAVRRRQRGGRRGRAPAGAAAARLRGAEERHRSVADGAAALRGEGAARLRAAVGDEHDHRDATTATS